MQQVGPAELPASVELEGQRFTLRLMDADDANRMLAFARSLPLHDLLFLRRDITRPEEIVEWIGDIESGNSKTIIALRGEGDAAEIVGYSAVARNTLFWMRHVAELRVLVAEGYRRTGLGRVLVSAAFREAVAMGVEKMMAQMTVDQEGAIGVFYRLGFEQEAMLRNHVKDRDGASHDIVVLSQDVSEYQAMRQQHEAQDARARQ